MNSHLSKVVARLTDFSELAELCEKLEGLSSRSEKITVVSQFLKKLEFSETEAAVRLIIGNPIADLNTRPLDVSFKTIVKSIEKSTEASDAEFIIDELSLVFSTQDLFVVWNALFEVVRI